MTGWSSRSGFLPPSERSMPKAMTLEEALTVGERHERECGYLQACCAIGQAARKLIGAMYAMMPRTVMTGQSVAQAFERAYDQWRPTITEFTPGPAGLEELHDGLVQRVVQAAVLEER